MMNVIQNAIATVNTWEDAVGIGAELIQQGSDTHWNLGDLVNKIAKIRASDPNLRKHSKTLKVFAQEIQQSYGIVKDAARVAKNVDPSLRIEFATLSYGHFREIVRKGYRGDEIREWATSALNGSWTVSKLRAHLNNDVSQPARDPKRDIRAIISKNNLLSIEELRRTAEENPEELLELKDSLQDLSKRLEVVMNENKMHE